MPDIAELTEQLTLKLPPGIAERFRPADRFIVWADTLKLPPGIAERFRPADRFIVWAEGEMLCLKRIKRPPITDIVARAPSGEPMSLDEINEIVHEVRQEYKSTE
jgi:hypothetical protein